MKTPFQYFHFPALLSAAVLAFLFSSCDFSFSSSKSMEFAFDGESKRIRLEKDGIERELVANQSVEITEGVISNYREGLEIKLSEERNGYHSSATLFEEAGVLKLNVLDDELIEEFYGNENEWLEEFLLSLDGGATGFLLSLDGSAKGKSGIPPMPQMPAHVHPAQAKEALLKEVGQLPAADVKSILENLEKIPFPADRKEIMAALLEHDLEEAEQVLVAGFILEDITFPNDQTELLLHFITNGPLSLQSKEYILDNSHQITFPADKEKVIKALVLN